MLCTIKKSIFLYAVMTIFLYIKRLNRPTVFIYLAVERFSSTRFVL